MDNGSDFYIEPTSLWYAEKSLGKATLEATGLFDEILVSKAGCTVTSHCGKDTFGVLFIEE